MSELRIYRFPEWLETPYKHVKLKRNTDTYKVDKAPPTEHEGRMSESLSRSRRLIQEYILCNHFDLFCTFTFDKEKVRDRHDYKDLKKRFSKALNNYRTRHDKNFQYLYIPELHKDGAVHFHGVMTVPYFLCCPLEIEYRDIYGKLRRGSNKRGYMDWPYHSERFGFFSCSWIRNYTGCALYVSKYMTKELAEWFERGDQIVMHSKGLIKPELVAIETDAAIPGKPKKEDYQGEFCDIAMRDAWDTAQYYVNYDDGWQKYLDKAEDECRIERLPVPGDGMVEITGPDGYFPTRWREYPGPVDDWEQMGMLSGG